VLLAFKLVARAKLLDPSGPVRSGPVRPSEGGREGDSVRCRRVKSEEGGEWGHRWLLAAGCWLLLKGKSHMIDRLLLLRLSRQISSSY
jgi:hypothetical protein